MRTFLIAICAASLALAGCGAGSQEIDKHAEKKSIDRAAILRGTFDSVQGDYSKLDERARKKYLEQFDGDEKIAKRVWEDMAHPPTGGPGAPIGG